MKTCSYIHVDINAHSSLNHQHQNQTFYLHADAEASSTSVAPFQVNRLAAGIADLTPDHQVLLS